jgi:CMP-N,N'-diacetyllegionaminic acid synthase
MKILALIPARGGSKRLPGKNIKPLKGKPLIVWTIDVVKQIQDICDILVSTDDLEIKSISANAGAYIPWVRPAELATDTASSVDVALHALDWYESEKGSVDGLLLLQPTSPFRSTATVNRGINLFKLNEKKPVLGVSATHAHPMWSFRIEEGLLFPFIDALGLQTRSQDLPPVYVVNGSFYLITPKDLRKHRAFVGTGAIPLVYEWEHEALDIDTPWDWKIAEFIASSLKNGRLS